MTKQRIYTIEQIDKIIEENGWSITICEKEKDGKYNFQFTTLQIAQEEDQDYFGEFVGKTDENKYIFKFYI
jgi:plasmid rolling circle replication initiator protein Rep